MIYTEAERLARLQSRIDTIRRAIDWIESNIGDVDLVFMTLQYTQINQHLKENPGSLAASLREALKDDASTGHRFGAWKAAQQICEAAGLPY